MYLCFCCCEGTARMLPMRSLDVSNLWDYSSLAIISSASGCKHDKRTEPAESVNRLMCRAIFTTGLRCQNRTLHSCYSPACSREAETHGYLDSCPTQSRFLALDRNAWRGGQRDHPIHGTILRIQEAQGDSNPSTVPQKLRRHRPKYTKRRTARGHSSMLTTSCSLTG